MSELKKVYTRLNPLGQFDSFTYYFDIEEIKEIFENLYPNILFDKNIHTKEHLIQMPNKIQRYNKLSDLFENNIITREKEKSHESKYVKDKELFQKYFKDITFKHIYKVINLIKKLYKKNFFYIIFLFSFVEIKLPTPTKKGFFINLLIYKM